MSVLALKRFWILCLALVFAWRAPVAAFAVPAPANKIGINVDTPLDWIRDRAFTDVMKASRQWLTQSNTPAAVDGNGWPTQDANIVVWAGPPNMQGTYRFSFTGKANVTTGYGSATITNLNYDAPSNTTTADLIYNGGAGLLLNFASTQRTAASATNTGITNVKLMRPRTVGGTTPYTTETFTDPFKAILAKFSVLRTKDFTSTDGNQIANWSDRTLPTTASQAIGNPNSPPGMWQGRGAAWEYVIELANETGKDVWISLPNRATDDYVTKVAQMFKYGSDGVNPYTSPQVAPVWPPLNSNLNLYVENSNELWNGASNFPQTQDNHNTAIAEVNAGGSPLNFDGSTNDWYWAWRRVAKRVIEISNIFRSVFGDADMMTRIRPVLMSQLGYTNGPLLQEMHMMQNYYNNPVYVNAPRPPGYYIYAAGGSGYYGPTDASSVDQIFATMASTFRASLQADANWSLCFGIKRIAYEGGPGLQQTQNPTVNANLSAAWADPRMTQVVINEHNVWSQNAGDLLIYFQLTGDYQFGFTDDVYDLTAPKLVGIDDLNNSTAQGSTYGMPIPATIAASTYAIPPSWFGGGTTLANRHWLGYPVYTAAAQPFHIVLNVAATSSGAQAEVFVDGQSLGILTVPNTGSVSVFADTASLVTPSLAAGSHGILVRNVSGTFVLNQIKVSAMQTSSTALALSSNPSVAGQQVTFTATAAPTGVTGSVQFMDGASTLGPPVTLANGTATYMTSSLSVGAHNISALYSGDSNYLPSTSAAMTEVITATGAVSTTTALNATAKTFFRQPVVFSVQVTATSGTATGNIILLEGNQQLGSSLPLNGSGAATFSTPLHPSVHNIQAVYLGNNNFNGSASTAQPVTASPRPKPR
ncbi:MAG TPA: Ig-like domain repeat protein [Terriglobales bacterium]|nr:Ig-like domain repeat protein [Terriglobales bacterium]